MICFKQTKSQYNEKPNHLFFSISISLVFLYKTVPLVSRQAYAHDSKNLLKVINKKSPLMSRRRGEFEHRTSIFEGAFRAWSHLGGLAAEDLESRAASDPDPLNFPLTNDSRDHVHEPLPRSGLSHPFVQAVLRLWLGARANREAKQMGLSTLRTWWGHRRNGQNLSARKVLNTEKMKEVVEGYTRQFFAVAYRSIMNEHAPAPRSLQKKIDQFENRGSKRKKRLPREEDADGTTRRFEESINTKINDVLPDSNLFSLKQLHATQRYHLRELRGTNSTNPGATQSHSYAKQSPEYGDPNTLPVIFIGRSGAMQIGMEVHGITSAYGVKIAETVLKGCNKCKSPISGLLDAAADQISNSILIKIDDIRNARRIAFEAARNLSMVGYTAKTFVINGRGSDKNDTRDIIELYRAFETIPSTEFDDIFDWTLPCTCPGNLITRLGCARHAQMGVGIATAFAAQKQKMMEYINGNNKSNHELNLADRTIDYKALHFEQPQEELNCNLQPQNTVTSVAAAQKHQAMEYDGVDKRKHELGKFSGVHQIDSRALQFERQPVEFNNDSVEETVMKELSTLPIDLQYVEDLDIASPTTSAFDNLIEWGVM